MLDDGVDIEVLVVDNDENQSAISIVNDFREQVSFSVTYISEPRKNISHARNSHLKQARGEWLAIIDDDEVADEFWLNNLLMAANDFDADVVFGVIKPVYPEGCPEWIKNGGFFVRKQYDTGIKASSGGSGCALIKRSSIGNMYFDPDYGLTGGEDANFFHKLYLKGRNLIHCNTAIVYEEIESNRLNLAYMTKRSFRVGQTFTKYRYLEKDSLVKTSYALGCLSKIVIFFILTVINLPKGKARYSRYFLRTVNSIGKVCYLVNGSVHKQYG